MRTPDDPAEGSCKIVTMRILLLLLLVLLSSPAAAYLEPLLERPVRKMAISEDTLFAAFGTTDTIAVYDLAERSALFEMPLDGATLTSLSVSRVGNRLAWGDDQGLVHLHALQTGESHGALRPFEQGNPTALAFSSDGRMLAVGSDQGELSVRIARNNSDRAAFKSHEGPVREIAWVLSEPQLVTLGDDGRLKLTNLITTSQSPIGETRTTPTLSLSLGGSAGNYFTSEADGSFLVRVLTDSESAYPLPYPKFPGARIRASSDNVMIAIIPPDAPPTYVRMADGRRKSGSDPVVDVAFAVELGAVIEAGDFGARLLRFAPSPAKPDQSGTDHSGHDHDQAPDDPTQDHTGHNH